MRPTVLLSCCLALAACQQSPRWQDATALDGDTFVEAGIHYRLAGIDAPELPGHCRPGRHCAPGDPYASKRVLQHFLSSGKVSCQATGLDYYHRTLVRCQLAGADLGASLLALGYAVPYRRS